MSTAPRRRLPGSYWRLFAGTGISNLGDGVLLAALPLLAARVSENAFQVGLISTLFTLPWLLFALPAGALIDRADRRRVLVVADLCRGVLVGALALVAAFADVQIWMLWLLALGLGIGEVFFDSASQTILPALVTDDQLERANGWRYSLEVATNTFVGLPIGSLLFAAALWLPFGVDSASFVIAALLAASLRGRFRSTAPAPAKGSIRSEIGEGFRWLWGRPLLRNMAVALALTNLAFAATESTFVLFATRELGVSEGFFGVLIAIVGGGAMLAGIVGGRLVDRVGRRFVILVAAFSPVLTMTAIGLLPVTWWVVVMTTVQAAMITMWSIVAVSLRQHLVPDHLFGRVNGVYRWFSWGAMPLGAALGGLVATHYGLRAPFFFGAAVMFVAWLMVATRLTNRAIDDAEAQVRAEHAEHAGPEGHDEPVDPTPTATEIDPFSLDGFRDDLDLELDVDLGVDLGRRLDGFDPDGPLR